MHPEKVDALPGVRTEFDYDLSTILDEPATSPGDWFKVEEDDRQPERMHRARYRFVQALRKQDIEGFEFTVRQGAVYGRKVG